jgi:hypothetical protein
LLTYCGTVVELVDDVDVDDVTGGGIGGATRVVVLWLSRETPFSSRYVVDLASLLSP